MLETLSQLDDTTLWQADSLKGNGRLSNVLQVSQLAAHLLRSPKARVIVTGDLNSSPGTLEMALLRQIAPCLCDAWEQTHQGEDGFTCNVPGNTW